MTHGATLMVNNTVSLASDAMMTFALPTSAASSAAVTRVTVAGAFVMNAGAILSFVLDPRIRDANGGLPVITLLGSTTWHGTIVIALSPLMESYDLPDRSYRLFHCNASTPYDFVIYHLLARVCLCHYH